MNYLFTVLCLVVSHLGLVAQNHILQDSIFPVGNELLASSNDLLFLCRESLEKETEAPLFLSEEWKKGILIDHNDKVYHVQSRYRVFDDEMQMQYDDKTKALFPQKIKAIRIGQMIFVPINFEKDGFETYGYFQVLSDGEVMLLKRFETSRGKIIERLYVKSADEAAQRLKGSRSCVLKVLKSRKFEMQQFVQQKGIAFGDEKDLVRLFDYYNQL